MGFTRTRDGNVVIDLPLSPETKVHDLAQRLENCQASWPLLCLKAW
jgi:hypothetical protein